MSGDASADVGDDRWRAERTTFQRVYDVLLGLAAHRPVADVAETAGCSENGARRALDQLVEMGIAERRDGRPATYRRNDAYLEWRRVESLAREHDAAALQRRLGDLASRDETLEDRFGVPEPDAVAESDLPDDPGAFEDAWRALSEWHTVRRDLRVVRRALVRTRDSAGDDAAP